MNLLEEINSAISIFAGFMWGPPLLIILLGGGIYFSFYSRFVPFKYFYHGISILFGRYNDPKDPGEITHFQALSSALASTVGLGNISGVAIAIQMGGPGALFWMWLSAILGMSTKFFSCTLSVLYRGKDDAGNIQGGPMYYIENGLGKKFKPLSILFSLAGLIGCTVIFQSNQLADIIRNQIFEPNGWFSDSVDWKFYPRLNYGFFYCFSDFWRYKTHWSSCIIHGSDYGCIVPFCRTVSDI